MVRYKSDCVGPCPQGCIGTACRYNRVPYLYCDKCGEQAEKLYSGSTEYDEICDYCMKEEIRELIEESESEELCDEFGYSEVNDYD